MPTGTTAREWRATRRIARPGAGFGRIFRKLLCRWRPLVCWGRSEVRRRSAKHRCRSPGGPVPHL